MIIIPARLASTRFPHKILTPIQSIPMVVATAKNAQKVDEVCVACDDNEVLEICKNHNLNAILTSKHHNSGTDRCNEAAKILGLSDTEIVINVQADEPFLEVEVISKLFEMMKNGTQMASCAKIITKESASDPNLVKVVLNHNNEAIYFSRSIIPYNRDNSECIYYGHLGIYGYSVGFLDTFCALKPSPLEEIEKLEQLRALYNGYTIQMAIVQTQSIGIDTPQDLQKALRLFGF